MSVLLLTAQLAAAALGVQQSATAAPQSLETTRPPITLSAAVSRARQTSPRRRGAALVAEGARDAARVAGRLPNPLFEMRTENWSHSTRSSTPDLDVFAVVAQPIELGNKRAIRRHLAFADRDVAESALDSLERELALETVGAYIRALKARALVQTLTSNREGLAAIIETMTRRVEEGYCAEADLLKFRTEAARVDGDIARAQLDMERSLAALTVAVGSAEPVLASQLVDPAPLDAPRGGPAVIAARIARHPDVLAANANIDRAVQLTAYERARRLPEPLVTGGYKRTSGFNTAVFGVSVSLPVFDRNDASIARAFAAERAAGADRDALVLRLTQDTAALIRAAGTIGERARQAQAELLAPAEDVRRAARAAFREGTADVLKLIDAERVYTDVHRAAIEPRLDALQIAIEARFALGEESIP